MLTDCVVVRSESRDDAERGGPYPGARDNRTYEVRLPPLFYGVLITFKMSSVLLFAAYDTTTSALCRALHLLAQHQDIQRRLRREIWGMVKKLESEGRTVQELGYDELNDLREMRWLEAVVREMMRV